LFKIIMLVKKKAELSQQEFLAHWASHSAKVLQYQNILRIRRYAKTLPPDAAARTTPEGAAALAELRADEVRFVDMAQSVMWLGEEECVVGLAGEAN
jgi:hypothetical protein